VSREKKLYQIKVIQEAFTIAITDANKDHLAALAAGRCAHECEGLEPGVLAGC